MSKKDEIKKRSEVIDYLQTYFRCSRKDVKVKNEEYDFLIKNELKIELKTIVLFNGRKKEDWRLGRFQLRHKDRDSDIDAFLFCIDMFPFRNPYYLDDCFEEHSSLVFYMVRPEIIQEFMKLRKGKRVKMSLAQLKYILSEHHFAQYIWENGK